MSKLPPSSQAKVESSPTLNSWNRKLLAIWFECLRPRTPFECRAGALARGPTPWSGPGQVFTNAEIAEPEPDGASGAVQGDRPTTDTSGRLWTPFSPRIELSPVRFAPQTSVGIRIAPPSSMSRAPARHLRL